MADTKITALAAITTVDPAADVLPIVDISDTSMAASGTTKKITSNQILGAGGTATLASATITGDLTVDTSTLKVDSSNNRVGVGTATPSTALEVATASTNTRVRINSTEVVATEYFRSGTGLWLVGSDSTNAFKIARGSNFGGSADYFAIASADAAATWYDAAGGTRMTLNSTGLGVGGSPTSKLTIFAGADGDVGFFRGGSTRQLQLGTSATAGYLNVDNGSSGFELRVNGTARVYADTSGNVGVGVTPSTYTAGFRALEINSKGNSLLSYSNDNVYLNENAYYNGAWKYGSTATAGQYVIFQGAHRWNIAPSGTIDTNITFTQAMTLTASGDLLVGTTSSQGRLTVNDTSLSAGTCRIYKNVASSESLPALTLDKKDNTSTTSQVFLQFTINSQTAGSGQINANGASQAAFGSYSDSRLKENIVSLPSQLANILSLRPVEFDYKDGSGHQIGFVAQEIQEVYADTVAEQNGFLTVTGWSKTEARLVSAIKELAAKVQALEAKLA